MEFKTTTVVSSLAVIGAAISTAFGGWSPTHTTLVIFMIIDYITGVIVAGVFQNSKKSASGGLESNAGFKGLCKKGVMLLIVLVASRLDLLTGSNFITTTVIIGSILNDGLSIIENAELMGIPVSKVFKKALDLLKTKTEEGND